MLYVRRELQFFVSKNVLYTIQKTQYDQVQVILCAQRSDLKRTVRICGRTQPTCV